MSTSPNAGSAASNQYGTFQVKYPSEPQVKYIKSLAANRVHPVNNVEFDRMLVALNDGTLNKKHASRMIETLLSMPVNQAAPQTVVQAALATQKQFDFIKSLLTDKEIDPITANAVQACREQAQAGTFTAKQASGLIDVLKGMPRKQTPVADAELEAGMYRVGNDVYKVYRAVHGSGKMCAKILVVDAEAKTGRFEYKGLASRFVRADQRMTLDQAKEFGQIYGVCCKCGATLTDEDSIAAGIGPVCASKGW